MTAKQFRSFEESREFVRKLGLKSKKEWYQYRKSGKKPSDIPSAPEAVYKNKGWKGWGDWLGTGRAATQDMIFKPFEEAREFVRRLGLRSKKKWELYCKSGKKPDDIPRNAHHVYKNKGWKGYGDWLGTGRTAAQDMIFKPFEEAREFVRKLGLKGQKEWYQYCKSGKKPSDIPSDPYRVYKNKGWKGWGDWLGNEFKLFEEAREFVRKLGLKNVEEWYQYRKSGKRPSDIPSDPWKIYKNKGWKGWGDWLGTGRKLHVTKPCPFEEWCYTVRKMGVKNKKDYHRRYKAREFPDNFPSHPQKVYAKKLKKKQKQLIFS